MNLKRLRIKIIIQLFCYIKTGPQGTRTHNLTLKRRVVFYNAADKLQLPSADSFHWIGFAEWIGQILSVQVRLKFGSCEIRTHSLTLKRRVLYRWAKDPYWAMRDLPARGGSASGGNPSTHLSYSLIAWAIEDLNLYGYPHDPKSCASAIPPIAQMRARDDSNVRPTA